MTQAIETGSEWIYKGRHYPVIVRVIACTAENVFFEHVADNSAGNCSRQYFIHYLEPCITRDLLHQLKMVLIEAQAVLDGAVGAHGKLKIRLTEGAQAVADHTGETFLCAAPQGSEKTS